MQNPPDSSGHESQRPPRRPRYRGKNPRTFQEKYKEHHPDQYPDDVAKVIAAGKTPAGSHRPIMVKEILETLNPRPGDIAVDCTLGYGGHAQALIPQVLPGGKLIGLDVDSVQLPKTESRLRGLGFGEEVLTVIRSNFAGLTQAVSAHAPLGVDLLLADLGLSSMQIDNPDRGFTFKSDGPLDMRMNPNHGPSAADLLAKWSAPQLAQILRENSDEPDADALSRMIIAAQQTTPIRTTQRLSSVVREACGKMMGPNHELIDSTVRRVFQGIRIAVNDEFGALDSLLRQLPWILRPGARAVFLTFHSGEDRRVKHHFRDGVRSGIYAETNSAVILASPEERRNNPRSSSAKLRFAVRGRSERDDQ